MDNLSALPQQQSSCVSCSMAITPEDIFCNSCGYPIKGTEEQQRAFEAVRISNQFDLEELNKKVKNAGVALFWVSGITAIYSAVMYFMNYNDPTAGILFGINLALALIYLVLGFWSRQKPVAALITGLSLYVLTVMINVFVEPSTILQGIIMKVIIIGYLIKGIRSAIEAEKILKSYN